MRKQTICVSDQVPNKPACAVTEAEKKRDCTIREAKTKELISCAVTTQLICAFVFAYADCLFSHAAAQLYCRQIELQCLKMRRRI